MRASIHHRLFGLVLLLLIAAALLPSLAIQADARSLFGRSAAFANTSLDPVVTPDNRFVLFAADLEINGVNNLYRVPIEGGQPVKLNAEVVAGNGVRWFALSPDGAHVVYIAMQEVENREELYSVPPEGGQPIKLSGALPAGGNVSSFQINLSSTLVVYLADQDTNDVSELYSVPIGGGTVKKLNAPLVVGGDVIDDYAISPNAQFVVYRADQEANDRYELYSAPTAGGAVEKLNGTLAAGGSVDYFLLSPVLNIAVYAAKQDSAYELYSVQLNGNPIAKLNGTLPAGKRVTFSNISADGLRVVYVIGTSFFGNGDGILYSVSIFGGASTQLSPTPSADAGVTSRRLSSDSKYTVFGFKANAEAAEILYSAALDGSGRAPLYNVDQNHGLYNLHISPDSAWVVFNDYDTSSNTNNNTVYAVPIGGGTPVQLSRNGENSFSPLTSPKSERVLFYVHVPGHTTCTESNLYSAQIFGGARRNLTDLCGTNGNIDRVLWSGDGSQIIYTVSYRDAQFSQAGFELFVSDGQALPPTATATSTQPTLPAETSTTSPTPTQPAAPTPSPTPPAQPTQQLVFMPVVQR